MELEKLAKELLEKEVLFQSDVEALIGKRPYGEKKPVHVVDDVPEELLHHAKSAEEIAALANQNGHAATTEPPVAETNDGEEKENTTEEPKAYPVTLA
jgi:cell division protease FtsH